MSKSGASCHLDVPSSCPACGNDTAINKNSTKCRRLLCRRLLCSPCNSDEFSLLCTILDGLLGGGGQVVDKKELGKRFICQTCFKSLSKHLQKMKACIKGDEGNNYGESNSGSSQAY